MSSYEYTDPAGDTITISPTTLRGGFPAIEITIEEQGTGSVVIPLAMVEEVVAGLRDMARQAGGLKAPGPCSCGYPNDEDTVHPTDGAPCYMASRPLPGAGITAEGLRLAEAAGSVVPHPITVHIEMGNEDALKAAIRNIVRRGPGEAGMTR